MRVLGLDIGGTSIKAAMFRGERWVKTLQSVVYTNPALPALRAAIVEVVGDSEVTAVGVCLPGVMKRSRVVQSVNLQALVGVDMVRLIGTALKLPRGTKVRFCSDAVATAVDIQKSRRLRGRVLVLALGTGVGCGVVDGDVPLDVDEGSPGHLGQMDVSIAGEDVVGRDGGRGGLEGYIGTPALMKRHPGKTLSAALSAYHGSEPPILALVRALRITHAIYRPQHIVLCGGIGLALRHLVPVIRTQVEKDLTSLAREGWTLSCGDDVFHAARGAARLVMNPRTI
jgi:predicted NBD/HSP70 family sugar kinase